MSECRDTTFHPGHTSDESTMGKTPNDNGTTEPLRLTSTVLKILEKMQTELGL